MSDGLVRLAMALGLALVVCSGLAMLVDCTPAASPVDAGDADVIVITTPAPCTIFVVDASAPQGPGK